MNLLISGLIGITLGLVLGKLFAMIYTFVEDKIKAYRNQNVRVDIYMLLTHRTSYSVEEKCIKLTRDQVNEAIVIWKNLQRNPDWISSEHASKMIASWRDVKDFGMEIPRPIPKHSRLLLDQFQQLVHGEIESIGVYNDDTKECAVFAISPIRARAKALASGWL